MFLTGGWHEILDFRFFLRNQIPTGPWVSYLGHFNFWENLQRFSLMLIIVGVIVISDKLPQVLLTLVIKPCSVFSLIPWQRQLRHRRWQWHQQSLIAGNNDTGDNLLPVTKTPWIIYCRGQRHRQWNICNTSKWTLSKNIIICVKKETQQNIKKLPISNFFHLSPVSLTSLINLYFRLSPQIFIKRPPLYT